MTASGLTLMLIRKPGFFRFSAILGNLKQNCIEIGGFGLPGGLYIGFCQQGRGWGGDEPSFDVGQATACAGGVLRYEGVAVGGPGHLRPRTKAADSDGGR